MPRASQLHKLNVRGINSAYERQGLAKTVTTQGSDTAPATIDVAGFWKAADTVTVTTDVGGGDVVSVYSPSGDEDAQAAADGIASAINAQADHTVAANTAGVVEVLKSSAGVVSIKSVVLT